MTYMQANLIDLSDLFLQNFAAYVNECVKFHFSVEQT